jgi:hypothetical protein
MMGSVSSGDAEATWERLLRGRHALLRFLLPSCDGMTGSHWSEEVKDARDSVAPKILWKACVEIPSLLISRK